MKIDAILWDYDGTLVNSVPKNIDITKEILAKVAPRLTNDHLPTYLKSESQYHIANHQSKNWQDLYVNYYGMTENEMLEAGTLWTEYQLKNTTPVELFSDIKQTITQIDLPQGICSQNSSNNILKVLTSNNLQHKFKSVIGYDDIPNNMQKPNPFGGLKCLEQIFTNFYNKNIIYIGDHEGDVTFAKNIKKELNNNGTVISVAVKYSNSDTKNWNDKPDYEINTPLELISLLNSF